MSQQTNTTTETTEITFNDHQLTWDRLYQQATDRSDAWFKRYKDASEKSSAYLMLIGGAMGDISKILCETDADTIKMQLLEVYTAMHKEKCHIMFGIPKITDSKTQ